MRGRTVIISVALHVVVFLLAMTVAKSRGARRATSVAVVGEKKKKVEKKEEKPKPKPKLVAAARPEPARPVAAPKAAPAPVPEPVAPQNAPIDTPITMGNDEVGMDVGGPAAPTRPATHDAPSNKAPVKTAPVVKKEKVLAPKDNPEEDTCTEAPSKPVPVQRATEIEYTQEARANGVEGRLVLKITVGADGSVSSVDVVSSVEPSLDAAAVAAVKTWVFKPAMRCGKPMAGAVFTLARRFELGD